MGWSVNADLKLTGGQYWIGVNTVKLKNDPSAFMAGSLIHDNLLNFGKLPTSNQLKKS